MHRALAMSVLSSLWLASGIAMADPSAKAPAAPPIARVVKSEAEWERILTADQCARSPTRATA
jgi:hypothetical protein